MENAETRRILQGLNDRQREAVCHQTGPLMVVAGAGTGKTRVITHRIGYLISSGLALPEQILSLTFTDKAALEMEDRVTRLLPELKSDIWISTFHSFGDRILRSHALELGYPTDFRLLTEPEQNIFFREHLFEFDLDYYRPLGNPTKHIGAFLSVISRAQDEDVSPAEYLDYVKALRAEAAESPDDPVLLEYLRQQSEIAATYQKYQELLGAQGCVTFGDQLGLMLKLLREHPLVLKKLQDRFRVILVDEFQDTNYAQFELIKLLAGERRNLTVVGDDDQSIYKFRGAAISNILGFMNVYPEAGQIVLVENFRSHQEVLDCSYKLISHNNPDRLEEKNGIDKRLTAARGAGGSVKHWHFPDLTTEAREVSREIRRLIEEENVPPGEIAILVRSNKSSTPFQTALEEEGIPFRFSGNRGLYHTEEVKLCLSFLRVIANPKDSANLFNLAISDIYRASMLDVLACTNLADSANRPLFDVFAESALSQGDSRDEVAALSTDGRRVIAQLCHDIRAYVEKSRSAPAAALLYGYLVEREYLRHLLDLPDAEALPKLGNLARFFDIIHRFAANSDEPHVYRFVEHVDMLLDAGDDPGLYEADATMNAVNVLTVHKAKGLEFCAVFLVSLVNRKFPSDNRKDPIELPAAVCKEDVPESADHLQEERRLFYVGMTRAKDRLYLTSATDYGGRQAKKVSRFVGEVFDSVEGERSASRPSPLETIRHRVPTAAKPRFEMEPMADDAMLQLSYQRVETYQRCPLQYKYSYILRVPTDPTFQQMLGRALHHALQAYLQARMQGRRMSLEQLKERFEAQWSRIGFLSAEHVDASHAQAMEVLTRFHNTEESTKISPKHVEKKFRFTLENNVVVGRWDRIDIVGQDAVIIDYKTSTVTDQAAATKRAKDDLQLPIYALAYAHHFGKLPHRLELRFLYSSLTGATDANQKALDKAKKAISETAIGIRAGEFPAQPSSFNCAYCNYSRICPHSEA